MGEPRSLAQTIIAEFLDRAEQELVEAVLWYESKDNGIEQMVSAGDQRSGKLTQGIVKDILTKSPTHSHGIKVRLESCAVGRVKNI